MLLLVLMILLAVAICLTTTFGEYSMSIWTVVKTIFGGGSPVDALLIRSLRLPRIIECVLIGAALGLSGAIFQALSRNPLASPDILGVNEGASMVAVWMILDGVPGNLVPLGACGGALGVVAVIAVLSVRRKFSMYRLILVGIGVNALAGTMIAYLLTKPSTVANFDRLAVAQQWLIGTMTNSDWHNVTIVLIALVVLTPLALVYGPSLNTWQLGDDSAAALGVSSRRMQLALALIAALLATAAVSVAGPIGFVAFLSPHIARRLSRTSSAAALPVSMAVGALMVLLSDYAAERILEPTELPVGILTVLLGAPYLLFLLWRAERSTGVM